jgi:transposase
MLFAGNGLKVFLALGATDMRKSVNGLSVLVSECFSKDPFSGHLFVFCNRRRTIMKILYWDLNGFCLWYKRLEKERFRWPSSEDEVKEISGRELLRLIDGLELDQAGAHKRRIYRYVS